MEPSSREENYRCGLVSERPKGTSSFSSRNTADADLRWDNVEECVFPKVEGFCRCGSVPEEQRGIFVQLLGNFTDTRCEHFARDGRRAETISIESEVDGPLREKPHVEAT